MKNILSALHPGLSGDASVRAPNIRSVKYATQNIIIHTNTAAPGQCPPVATSCLCHPGVTRDSHVGPKSEIWMKSKTLSSSVSSGTAAEKMREYCLSTA